MDPSLDVTKNLGLFLSQAWLDGVLRWRVNDDVEGTYHPMHLRQFFDWEDTLEQSKTMGAMYVLEFVDSSKEKVSWFTYFQCFKTFQSKTFIQVMKNFV